MNELNPFKLAKMLEELENTVELHSISVRYKGEKVVEGAWAPFSMEEPQMLHSLSKIGTSICVGFAVDEGKLHLEDKFLDYVREDLPDEYDEALENITVYDLLTMQAGSPECCNNVWFSRLEKDWEKNWLGQPKLKEDIGKVFHYDSGCSYTLSRIVTKVMGENCLSIMQKRVFDKLGFGKINWLTSPEGHNTGGWGMYLTADQISTLAQLLLQKGNWKGVPKIIHYCWFGGGPINPESRKCIESWKKYCPDYKIIEWNEQNFEISQNRYAQQAYEAKKYAFVSDYVRLAVLYEYGGIYLDTDVELVRPLDELLEHKGFIGMEHSAPSPYGRTLLVNTGSGVGAEPGCEMIGKMLAAYRNAAFIQETGEPDLRTCTQRDTPLFTKAGLQQKNEQQELDGFLVLPTDCFSPFDYVTERMHRTPRTFGIHYYQGSWQSGDKANRWRKRFKCTKVGR